MSAAARLPPSCRLATELVSSSKRNSCKQAEACNILSIGNILPNARWLSQTPSESDKKGRLTTSSMKLNIDMPHTPPWASGASMQWLPSTQSQGKSAAAAACALLPGIACTTWRAFRHALTDALSLSQNSSGDKMNFGKAGQQRWRQRAALLGTMHGNSTRNCTEQMAPLPHSSLHAATSPLIATSTSK